MAHRLHFSQQAQRLVADCPEFRVFIAYLDDSEQQGRFKVIGGVIIHHEKIRAIENAFAGLIEDKVPAEFRKNFEVHGSRLLSRKESPYSKILPQNCHAILEGAIAIAKDFQVPIVYGAVDLKRLRAKIYCTANPLDMAFRLCAEGVEKWFKNQAPDDSVLYLCDTGTTHHTAAIHNAFRMMRRPLKERGHNRGQLEHAHDAMYFGESAESVGIQLADVCCLAILRHLCQAEDADSERWYAMISKQIYSKKSAPSLGVKRRTIVNRRRRKPISDAIPQAL